MGDIALRFRRGLECKIVLCYKDTYVGCTRNIMFLMLKWSMIDKVENIACKQFIELVIKQHLINMK